MRDWTFRTPKTLRQAMTDPIPSQTVRVFPHSATLRLPDGYPLQPSPHWSFNGQSFKALYEAVHDGAE